MKTKTKMIIALSLAGVITLGAVIALVVVIASFNATAGSGISVSYVAQNVEAEVSMGYVVSETNTYDPKSLTYTTVQAGSDEKLTFSSSDTAETVSKSFDSLGEIELTKDGYVYLKYTFKHTGTTANSHNYLNVTLNNTFSTLNNIEIEYMLYNPDLSIDGYTSAGHWMAGVNGLTITRDTDNECILFARAYVDVKTQNALLDGSLVFSMTTSDADYYANLKAEAWLFDGSVTSITFGTYTEENVSKVEGIAPTSLSSDGSGPINEYTLTDGSTYVLSDSEIFATSCDKLFHYCASITSLDLGSLNTLYVKNMSGMFSGFKTTSLELTNLKTSNVKNMDSMFYDCDSLTNLDLSSFDTSNVTNMAQMFYDCDSLTNLDLSSFDTSNVTNMERMFYDCGLTSLDLSSFNTSNVTNMAAMFGGCAKLQTIYVLTNWDTSSASSVNMFGNGTTGGAYCSSLVGGNGTVFNTSYIDATYARIDTAETPGYFTLKTA